MTEQEKQAAIVGALRSALQVHNCDIGLLQDRAERMAAHDGQARPAMRLAVVDEQVPDLSDIDGRRFMTVQRVRVVGPDGEVLKNLDGVTPLEAERYVREYIYWNPAVRWTLRQLVQP